MLDDKSFLHNWQVKADQVGDTPYMKVVQTVSPPVLSYTHLAFQKRAMRVAVAFKRTLGIPEGSRVILMLEEPNELSLLLHGLWMAKICAIPVRSSLSPEKLLRLLSETEAEYVLFPPSYSARVASIIDRVERVKNWIVTGNAGQVNGVANLKSLEDLLLSAAGDTLTEKIDEASQRELLLLPSFDDGLSWESYTESALLKAASVLRELYPQESLRGLSWNTYPLFSFDGILHSFLAPFSTGIPSLVMPIGDSREFWRHLAANEVCFACITHRDAAHLFGQGKPKALKFLEGLTIAISTESYFSERVINDFIDRFDLPVKRFFSYAPAGGLISVAASDNNSCREGDYMSAGKPLSDVDIVTGDNHSLLIRTERLYKSAFGKNVPSEIDGYIEAPYCGSVDAGELWLEGKTEDIDYREGKQVNLARIEQALLSLRGVTYAVAACMPGKNNDREIGVFLATHRLANLTQNDLEKSLREILDENELPYIYEFASSAEESFPDRKELEERLMFY